MRFNLLIKTFAGLIALAWIVPVILVCILAFGAGPALEFPPKTFGLERLQALYSNVNWSLPMVNSLKCAGLTVVLAILAVVPAVRAVAALDRNRRVLVTAAILISFPLSNLALATGQFFLFVHTGYLNTILPLALSHTVLALPMVFIILSSWYGERVRNLEMTARVFGADGRQGGLLVALPLSAGALSIAALIGFITSFDESVSALLLTTSESCTLPRRIFDGLRYNIDPVACAAATLSVVMWLLVLFVIAKRSPE